MDKKYRKREGRYKMKEEINRKEITENTKTKLRNRNVEKKRDRKYKETKREQ